jgi:hypothetical protein
MPQIQRLFITDAKGTFIGMSRVLLSIKKGAETGVPQDAGDC